jgi:hypothetical protein
MTLRPRAAPRAGLSATVAGLFGLRRRRPAAPLAALDDWLLRDIGLTRREAEELSRR